MHGLVILLLALSSVSSAYVVLHKPAATQDFLQGRRGNGFEDFHFCCKNCTAPGEDKFYSIDTTANNCGEACMKPVYYPLYKVFEKNLERANGTDSTPCRNSGYTLYKGTVTHGFGPIKMTLDLYGPTPKI